MMQQRRQWFASAIIFIFGIWLPREQEPTAFVQSSSWASRPTFRLHLPNGADVSRNRMSGRYSKRAAITFAARCSLASASFAAAILTRHLHGNRRSILGSAIRGGAPELGSGDDEDGTSLQVGHVSLTIPSILALVMGFVALLPLVYPLVLLPLGFAEVPEAIGGGLYAYGHYASLIVAVGCLMIERLAMKRGQLTGKEIAALISADSGWGIFALGLILTGAYRAGVYGKGWDFYLESPLFWGKMLVFGVLGALSLYPTTMFLRWSYMVFVEKATPKIEKGVTDRIILVQDIELALLCTVPLLAGLMARGVLKDDIVVDFYIAAALVSIPVLGLCTWSIRAAVDEPVVPLKE